MSTGMFIFSKTPEATDAMWSQLREGELRRTQYQAAANMAVARSVGDFHSRVPYADPGVALAVGSAAARGQVDPAAAAAAVDRSTAQGNRPAWSAKESAGIVDVMRAGALAPPVVAVAHAAEVKSRAKSDVLIRDPTTGAVDAPATLKAAGVSAGGGGFDWSNPVGAVTDPIGFLDASVGAATKGVVREGLSVAQSGWEAAQNRAAQGVHAVQDVGTSIASGDVGGAVSAGARALAVYSPMPPVETWYSKQVRSELLGTAEATNVGQQAAQQAQLGSVDLGSGFFPGGTVTHTWQPQEARNVRGVIPGTNSAWTYGRGAASLVTQAGTPQYNMMSGVIDAAMQFALDPAIALSDSALAARKAGQLLEAAPKAVETIEGGGEAAKAPLAAAQIGDGGGAAPLAPAAVAPADAVREAAQGVLIDAERPTVNAMRADRFIEHPAVEPYLQRLTDSRDPLETMQLLGPHAPPSLISAVTKSSDLDVTKGLMRDELGTSYRSTADLPGMQWNYDIKRQVIRHLPGVAEDTGEVTARGLQTVPDRRLQGFRWDSTPMQQRQTMDSINDALKTVKVPTETRSDLMGKFADAFAGGTSEDKYNALMAYSDAANEAMKALGAPKEFADTMTKIWGDTHNTSSLYGIDAVGRPADGGFMATATGNADLSMISPAKLSEGMSGDVYLPDFRQVRRMTSRWGRILSDTKGPNPETWGQQLRFPLSAAQFAAEKVFPRIQITRIATALRVFGDEQIGMAVAGLDTNITHPFQLLASVLGSSTDLERLGIDSRTAQGLLDEAGASLFNADAPDKMLRAARATGHWEDVPFTGEKGVQGGLDMARQFSRDPISALWAQGKTTDQIIDWLHGVDPEAGQVAGRSGPDAFAHYVKLGANAVARDAETGVRVPAPVDLTDPDVLRGWVEQNIGGQVDAFTKGNTDLRNAIGYNRLPGASSEINPETGLPVGTAFAEGGPTPEMQRLVRDWSNHPDAPERVKWNKTVMDRVDPNTIRKQWDHATNTLMSGLFDTPLRTFTRSPLYRAEFFDRVAELGSKMSPEAANSFLNDIRANADEQGMVGKVAEWLGGGGKRLDRIVDSLGQASGDLTKDEVTQYAHGHALDVVKSALFDHGRTTNLEQTLRSFVPFVGAWRQVIGRWIRFISQNPGVVRRFQTVVQGARGSGFFFTDPVSGEERFNIPGSDWVARQFTSGGVASLAGQAVSQMLGGAASHLPVVGPAIQQGVSDVVDPLVKALPVVGAGLAGAGPGVGVPLGGNVKDLNIVSGSFLPGFGPIIQAPAAHILGNVPQADFIRGLLMPYGVPTDENAPVLGEVGAYVLPGWMQKVVSAVSTSPDSASSFGGTYLQVVQQLASSGKYGTDLPQRQQMLSDAKNYAKVLTVLRGLGQFVSPASPSYDPTVATKSGDVLMSQLAADYHTMQSQDYNTAVQKFLDTYGEGPLIAAMSKSKSTHGGLDASTEFGNWERDHGATMGSYPDVAAYFAPVGSDFDFEVYNRQLASGERKKLSGDELVNAAQATIAEWKYRQFQAMLGPHPNVAQLNWLTDAKKKLQDQYPGYAVAPGNPTDLAVKIAQLTKAQTDPALKGDAQTALATYLYFRNQALASAQQRAGGKESATITSEKNADLRAWLAGAANQILAKYPSFARLYDGVLAGEVNQ